MIAKMGRTAAIVVFIAMITVGYGQFASMFDRAQQAENCASWSEWGDCVWVKGPQSHNKSGYFSQLSPTCRNSSFFVVTRDSYGQAIENVYSYLKDITKDDEACGLCSYRQSCGSKCDTRRRGNAYINRIFVAEERCNYQQLDGNDQLTACYTDYDKILQTGNPECKVWPNPNIRLPNVPDMAKDMIYGIPLFNCVKALDDHNKPVCRCCCAPFVPSPEHKYLCLDPKT